MLSLCALAAYFAAVMFAFGMSEATFVRGGDKFLLDIKVTNPKISVYFSNAVGFGCKLAPAGFLDAPNTLMWGPSDGLHKRSHKIGSKVYRGKKASFLMSVEPKMEVFAVILFASYIVPVGVFVRIGKLL